jgi:hypothetical protein
VALKKSRPLGTVTVEIGAPRPDGGYLGIQPTATHIQPTATHILRVDK